MWIADTPQPGQNSLSNPYGQQPDFSPDDRQIIENRDQALGQPVGKGVMGSQPILLAKLSLNQEIDVTCKAYKVGLGLLPGILGFLDSWILGSLARLPDMC